MRNILSTNMVTNDFLFLVEIWLHDIKSKIINDLLTHCSSPELCIFIAKDGLDINVPLVQIII